MRGKYLFLLLPFLLLAGCSSQEESQVNESRASNAQIVIEDLTVQSWDLQTNGKSQVKGQILLSDDPVKGATVQVGDHRIAKTTDKNGIFSFAVETDEPRLMQITIYDADSATVSGRALKSAQVSALENAKEDFSIAYEIQDFELSETAQGNTRISGTLQGEEGLLPAAPLVFAFRLYGTITKDGEPLEGARVSTRTADREVWTLSPRTDEKGQYDSWFWPSTEASLAPYDIRVSKGRVSYEPNESLAPKFKALQSARLDIDVDHDMIMDLTISPEKGLVYEAFFVGVAKDGKLVEPLSATVPDKQGRFMIEVQGTAQGLSLWQARDYFYSPKELVAGGNIPEQAWPDEVPQGAPVFSLDNLQ